ncbi:putative transporter [Podospora australis]|uniref:Transporter n=1 Tax=Podospora australis TaxID=1536484 RepID=A0AAN6WK28_9PEZI|nr:putative transporter [Podospora australis]
MAGSGLFESFLGAIQASLSVLLVMSYGGVAGYLGLLDRKACKSISTVCVRIFLPALLITKLGSELNAGSGMNYVPIVIWGVVCHLISFGIGMIAQHGLGMPDWATVAILINNTTSYPLLLIAALEETGILESLIVADESAKEAVERAKSYFLVFSTMSNCITFAIGPRLIEDGGPDSDNDQSDEDEETDVEANENTHLLPPDQRRKPQRPRQQSSGADDEDENRPAIIPENTWDSLSDRTKWWSTFILDFFNAPLIGALIGALLGLVPALHKAFFNSPQEGGIFTSWLTASLKTISALFAPLPVIVTGVSLFDSLRDTKRGKNKEKLPWGTVGFILGVRFIIWPIASIGLIWALASKTSLLGSDPILWFTLMLMPTGPSAQKLISLVQVSDVSKEQESLISRLLAVSLSLLDCNQKEESTDENCYRSRISFHRCCH